ncbi:DUF5305 family protein [Anaerosolibacter sp.]|uniref:DUF5305 family protein n=1 Tax=Anaerosolibacter sp. TaxID=1872527 RepID=UPI0039EF3427
MRIRLHRYVRLTVTILSVLFITTASFMLYRELKVPSLAEEKAVLYSYKHKTDAKYRVFLKPNILYDANSLVEGQLYLTKFVDYIRTYFQYEFTGETDAEIFGDYAVVAAVEGYIEEKEKIKTIWKKEFTLIPKTDFKTKDRKITIDKEVSIRLEEYNIFATQVSETSKANVPVKLSLLMNINIKADTGKEIMEERLTPALIIPLNTNYFEIVKGGMEEKPGAIEETKQVPQPPNKNLIILYSTAIVTFATGLIYLVFFTSIAPPIDPLVKQLNCIFKKYGSRLVALNSELALICETYSKVRSIDDLVRIADELGRPIMYQYHSNPKDITQFYIMGDTLMYIFDIRDGLNMGEGAESTKDNKQQKDDREEMVKEETIG